MGIPSYYKKLCDSIHGLLLKNQPNCEHLLLDFNCLIYHCIRRPGMRAYPGHAGRKQWERDLIKEVCAYTKSIVEYVQPTKSVFLAVDGVVPMAKIKQQRLRRFKSIWTSEMEYSFGKPQKESWDTNAITPGTEFMDTLTAELTGLCTKMNQGKGVHWSVSGIDHCGEGEQKLMKYLKGLDSPKQVCVYGLDADLIILSLMATQFLANDAHLYLFREVVEMGTVQYNSHQEEKYHYFDIHTLRKTLVGKSEFRNIYGEDALLRDYCMAMSLLGNDFLPHSLTFKLKGSGHHQLLDMLKHIWKKGLLVKGDGRPSFDPVCLAECFAYLASKEEEWMRHSILTKYKGTKRPFIARGDGLESWERDIQEWNASPAKQCDELMLFDLERGEGLRKDWKQVYTNQYLGIPQTSKDYSRVLQTYIYGLQWISNYYHNSTPSCWEWHYPWHVPPCWSDLAKISISELTQWLEKNPGHLSTQSLLPQEQLACVLPLESWSLLRDKELRQIVVIAPHYWPKKFSLFMAGRTMMWECPALIPTITPSSLRTLRNLLRK